MTSTLLPGNIVYGGPIIEREAQDYRSLGQFVLDKYKGFGDQTVLVDAVSGAEYTASFMHKSIVRLAHILQKLGVKQNDVIGLSSENSVNFALAMFAGFAVGATVAPLNVTYSEREVDHALNLSKPKIIFASKITIDRIAKVASKNKFVKGIIALSGSSKNFKTIYALNEMMDNDKYKTNPEFLSPVANKNEDVALIVCSSGTTGLPKGVQLTQMNLLATLDSQIQPTMIPMSEITLLTVIPWFHAFGCLTLITTACMGARLVYLPKFEENLFLSAIEKYRVMMAFMVPPLMVFLAKHPIVEKYDLSSLMVLLCGAAPLSRETEDQIKERIGVPFIRQGYGLSESTLSVLVQNDDFCKPGSVGVLKVGIYAKVIDPDTGKLLGANERGELCFKGDGIMKGYIGDTKSTQTAIKDGWLHTGDIGYYDDDFEFFIVDRIKELIKYKGFQVPPAEIEALLLTHEKIKDAAVIGKPDEAAGELPLAFVVKQANVQLTENDVIQFVNEHASPAKRLRGGVIFVDEIPKNPSGKILRRILRNMLKKQKSKL
ncbi:4-coumarate--CoA ligase 1 [Drosophila guanche]|uniref:Luciferin 4-monooxygenase n=1 Tax=Drosophila guanche TaxID=7266 RepID=A0A3B0JK27_DROGU|nr:4-coumarate--CoA ligase 1 [Drosophila guanche]XP_034130369.1 4-coumarate--CoA ligase 1 [Drosophila guanche]SPP82704.1 blast:Luciferin 4-monooxygenase [Drosophila guanche]